MVRSLAQNSKKIIALMRPEKALDNHDFVKNMIYLEVLLPQIMA